MFFKTHKQQQALDEALQLEQFTCERARFAQQQLLAAELATDQAVRLELSGQALETLREELEQARHREKNLQVELSQHIQRTLQHQHEAQIWELLQSTLTEGCWDICVVNGDIQHPASCMRFSNQFRLLMEIGRAHV